MEILEHIDRLLRISGHGLLPLVFSFTDSVGVRYLAIISIKDMDQASGA